MNQAAYPVQFSVSYPDRPLDRVKTLFRPIAAIPILLVLGAVSGATTLWTFADGTRIERTTVASRRMATPRPNPSCWMKTRLAEANPPKTATMIKAAPVMIRAVLCSPTATDSALFLLRS